MPRLLVIDENPHRAEAIQLMLRFAMYETDIIADGNTALAYLKNGILPDAIITNTLMPGVDGFHLVRRVKLTPEWAHIPVLLIAEKDALQEVDNLAVRAGAAALLRRPLERDTLLAEIDRALLMGGLEGNPLAKQNPAEELAFLRDHNHWLAQVAYQAKQGLDDAIAARDLREAHLYAIDNITTALGENLNLHETCYKLASKTADLLRAQAVAVYICQQEEAHLGCAGGFGIPTPELIAHHRLDPDSPIATLATDRQALLFQAESIDKLVAAFQPSIPPISAIVSPLVAAGELGGFLLVMRLDTPFVPADAATLLSLAGAAGLALRGALLFNELQTAYENLQELDRRKSEFVAITSHELRTPIAIMLGYASLLADLESDPAKRDQLAAIEKQAHFLTGLVDTLLNLHELNDTEDPLKIRCQPVQVDILLQEALDVTLTHNIYNKGVEFTLDCDAVEIIGDDMRLLLALNNLMDNAIKFSEPDQAVRVVAVQTPEGGALISVEDEGVGIDPQYFEQIFEPFFQVEEAITRHHGGLGLGLAIVKGMVELHGGSVEVHSKLGAGSRFTITLPPKPPEGRCRSFGA